MVMWRKLNVMLFNNRIYGLTKGQFSPTTPTTNSSFDTPGRPLIEELGWKTIEELIGDESKTMVFKSLKELAPQYLCNLFTKNSECSSRSLRNTETDLRLPKKKSANGQKCFSFRGAKLWNSLPAESKMALILKNLLRVDFSLYIVNNVELL